MNEITYLEAIRRPATLADDPRVFIYGQTLGDGGAFKATKICAGIPTGN